MSFVRAWPAARVAAALASFAALVGCEPCPPDQVCFRGRFVAPDGEPTGNQEVTASAVAWERLSPVGGSRTDADGWFLVAFEPTPLDLATYFELSFSLADRAHARTDVVVSRVGELVELPAIELPPLGLRADDEDNGVRLRWQRPSPEARSSVDVSWPDEGAIGLGRFVDTDEILVPDWMLAETHRSVRLSVSTYGTRPAPSVTLLASIDLATPRRAAALSAGAPCTLRDLRANAVKEVFHDPCPVTDGDPATVAAWSRLDSDTYPPPPPGLVDLTIDLGEVREIRGAIALGVETTAADTRYLLGSVDGEQWTRLPRLGGSLNAFLADAPVSARHVRFERIGHGAWSIRELHVY